jgi:hypothetical protein
MGMQNGRVNHQMITASSYYNKQLAPQAGRLNHKYSWCAAISNHKQWLQVDFRKPSKIVRIATQGRGNSNQWVTYFYVRHSVDGVYFSEYTEFNTKKVDSSIKQLTLHSNQRSFGILS